VSAGGEVTVDLAMAAQAISLAEIVVTGYGQQTAGNITGAVSAVQSADFNQGRVISPTQLIQNKVPGVQVVDNNEPGGGVSIRIRGATSINASNEPMYVIDGVPIGFGAGGGLSAGRDPLASLNPNEIESITVLRDASAAAIYGANAANGVIIIETKKGKKGVGFEYNGSFSTSQITRTPSMLNAEQFRAAVTQYAPQNVSQLQNQSVNWYDQVTQTGYGADNNFAFSGAGENTNWRVSLGYLTQEGIVQGTKLNRLAIGANLEQMLFNDRLEIRANVKGSQQDDDFTPGGVLSNAAQFGPTQPIYDEASATGYYEWPGNKLTSADNPVAILGLATETGSTYRSSGALTATYRMPFLEALRARVSGSYDVAKAERKSFQPSTMHSQTKTGTYGSDYRANNSQNQTNLEAYLNYVSAISSLPGTVDVTGGYSYSYSYGEYPWYNATGLATDLLEGNGVTSAKTVQNFQDIQEAKLISFFGRLNYNIDDKYILMATLRRDGSSRFGPENAWGTFPSVALAWRLSEDLFPNSELLSDMKLRASWAKTGNQAFANYQQYSTYLVGDAQSQVLFGNEYVPTIRPGAVDPNVRWEETQAYNIGLDVGLWNQRVSASFEWYTKDTDDLLFNVPVAAGTNLSNYLTTNIGSMKNTGIELGLSARVLEGGDKGLSYTADFSVAHNTNELTAINPILGSATEILVGGIAGGVGTTIQVLRPGVPINSFYVYEQKYDDAGKPIEGSYVDRNNDGTINVADRRPYKDPFPDWNIGHSSYFNWGKFDAGFTLRAYLGNYVYNNVASNLGTYIETTRGAPYNLHSSVLETGFTQPQYLSDYYVEDGSFLRMDQLTAGYTFQLGGQPWRVFGVLQNAFTITGYDGVDPTAGLLGIDNNIYPRSRTFSVGLSLRQ
jgi:iron complex outermembrane receptor protein